MKITEFYKKTLKRTKSIQQKLEENGQQQTHEISNIYSLAFCGLLCNHYPFLYQKSDEAEPEGSFFTIEVDGEEYRCSEKQAKIFLRSRFYDLLSEKDNMDIQPESEPEPEPTPEPEPEPEPELKPEQEKEKIIPAVQLELPEVKEAEIIKYKTKANYEYDNQEEPYIEQEQKTQPEPEIKPPVVEERLAPPEKSQQESFERKSIMLKNKKYPDDQENEKTGDSFLFNKHEIIITKENGVQITLDALIYPISTDTEDTIATDIAVVLSSNDRIRCKASESFMQNSDLKNKSVEIEFDDLKFVAHGRWKNGKFQTNIKLINPPSDKLQMTSKFRFFAPRTKTSTFMKQLDTAQEKFMVFPVNFMENRKETGLAKVAVLIDDGLEKRMLSSGENDTVILGNDTILQCYWMGGIFFCEY